MDLFEELEQAEFKEAFQMFDKVIGKKKFLISAL